MNPPKSAQIAAALTALALCVAPASGLAAAPDPAFAAFTTVCGEPAGDFAAVRAAADTHAWGAAEATTDSAMPGVTIGGRLTRGSNAGGVSLVLSAWHGATAKGVKVSACTVHVAKSDFGALREAATAWLAFAPADSADKKKAVYRYTDKEGAHHALAASEYDAAASGAGLEILTVSGDANGTLIDLLVIKK